MEVIEWDESYSVGVEELDEQHKQLFRIINNLFEVSDVGDLTAPLADMREYAAVHFETEERYMSECGYPEIANHIQSHHYYGKKVNDFCARNMIDRSELTADMIRFLYDWLAEHILTCDKRYAPFLRGCQQNRNSVKSRS